MRQAVCFRASLPGPDRARLDEYTMWPMDRVTDEGRDVGCLMPAIPDQFFARVQRLGRTERVPRGIEYLPGTYDLRSRVGLARNDNDQLDDGIAVTAVLAKLAYCVGLLHKHGLVYGDIGLKCAVFSLNPHGVMLLGCDGARALSDPDREQLDSPFFDAAEARIEGRCAHQYGPDQRSDVYKLALVVVRCLSRGHGACQLRNADHLHALLDPATLRVLCAALAVDPDSRPSASELYSALAGFVRTRSRAAQV